MTSEQEYKVEVYYGERSVFKAAYYETLEEAERAVEESFALDESVCEARMLDHSGRIVRTIGEVSS